MRFSIIAKLTLKEAFRKKILFAAFILGILFLGVYALGFNYIRLDLIRSENESLLTRIELFNFMSLTGLYVVNFLTVMLIVLASVDTVSGEILSGTIQTIVTKPIRRWEVILGKWIGFSGMLLLYIILMAGGVIVIVKIIGDYSPDNLLGGLSLLYLNGLLMLSVSIAGGATFSTLSNGVVVFGLYGVAFIGGWIEQIGSFMGNQTAINIGIITSLILPSEVLWKRAAYEMRSPIVSVLGFSPFSSSTSIPSQVMIWYALLYVIILLLLGIKIFYQKDLQPH